MKKIFNRFLLLLSMIAALCFAAAACSDGNDSTDLQPPVAQDSVDGNVQPADRQPEQTSSEQETSSGEQSSESGKPAEETPSQGETKLPGGLVDMGNFESRQE